MKNALVVARWEYLEKVRSKAFLISLILTPAIMFVMGVLPGIFAGKESDETHVIGLLDRSGKIAPIFGDRLAERYTLPNGSPRYLVEVLGSGPESDARRDEADARVVAKEMDGYVIVSADLFADSVVEYRGSNVGDFRVTNRIEETMRQIVMELRFAARGADPELLREIRFPLAVRPVKVTAKGEEEGGFERVFFSAYVFLMMLFFLILTSGQLLVRSVIEEKSNRIVEVLVSSVSPTDLMAGKVLGLSALGFTQIGFWALIGTAISLQAKIPMIDPGHALLLVLYFVLGYLFYAAVFIALGSPLNTEQEAQQVNSYLVLILILPLVLALPVIQNPDAAWIRVLTYIPFLTSPMMALRIPVQLPSTLEILATTVLMILSIYGAMWSAGRIFRIAILATGKRPTLREMSRWIRSG